MERPRHKANNPKTLHPGHALGTVSKRVGMIRPRRQTNCSLGQGRASPAQYLPRLLCRARAKFGSYSGGNPLFQKWQKLPLKQRQSKLDKVLCKSVLGSKLLRREVNFGDFGLNFLQNCHFYFSNWQFYVPKLPLFSENCQFEFLPKSGLTCCYVFKTAKTARTASFGNHTPIYTEITAKTQVRAPI